MKEETGTEWTLWKCSVSYMMLLRLLWIFKLVTVQKNPRSRSRQLMFDYIPLVQARLSEAHNVM